MAVSGSGSRPGRFARKVAATVVVLAAFTGFEVFVAHGAFDAHSDRITPSVLAQH